MLFRWAAKHVKQTVKPETWKAMVNRAQNENELKTIRNCEPSASHRSYTQTTSVSFVASCSKLERTSNHTRSIEQEETEATEIEIVCDQGNLRWILASIHGSKFRLAARRIAAQHPVNHVHPVQFRSSPAIFVCGDENADDEHDQGTANGR